MADLTLADILPYLHAEIEGVPTAEEVEAAIEAWRADHP